MRKTLGIIGAVLFSTIGLFALAQSTPTTYTIQWCNGRDGGWVDGGAFDGGVCADAGTSCQSCGGTCLTYADGGTACAPDPFAILDAGAKSTAFGWPVPTQTIVSTIFGLATATPTSAYPSCQLQGSNTGFDPWINISGAVATLTAASAGSAVTADAGLIQTSFGYPFSRWVCTTNADGGVLAATVSNK